MKDFENWCRSRGFYLSVTQLRQFEIFKENLLDWNSRMNLTAITDDEGIWQKHFADSLTLLPFLPEAPAPPEGSIRMIDVGCGAGFPGLPIKIMRPDIKITMLDSLRKRVNFLEDTVSKLGLLADGTMSAEDLLPDVECVHARAEDFVKLTDVWGNIALSSGTEMPNSRRGSYDICCARAVARLDKLCKWCLPFVKPAGGVFLAMKGPDLDDELTVAMPAIRKLGAKVIETRLTEIVPGLVHSVVVMCYTGYYN